MFFRATFSQSSYGNKFRRALNKRTVLQSFLALTAGLGLMTAGLGDALANTQQVQNLFDHPQDFKVDATFNQGGTATITFTVPANQTVEIGGPNGIGLSKGKEINPTTKAIVTTVADLGPSFGASLTAIADEPQIDTGQFGHILTGIDGSPVYSFFDFAVANYTQLDANVPFVFSGFTFAGGLILDLESDPTIQITDLSGSLLPQYAFTAPTVPIASIAIFAPVPELSTWAFIVIGFVGIAFMTRPQRKKAARAFA